MLLIVDDIQVGCGRTGPFFSFEPAGIRPDIVTLSKSLSGVGQPLSLVLLRPELDAWAPGEHNGTFRGNNAAFVTAAAALDYWRDDGLTRRVERNAAVMRAALDGLRERWPDRFAGVRGRGMIQGLVCAQPAEAGRIAAEAYARGLLVETCGREDEVVKLLPPLTIDVGDPRVGPGSLGGGGRGGRVGGGGGGAASMAEDRLPPGGAAWWRHEHRGGKRDLSGLGDWHAAHTLPYDKLRPRPPHEEYRAWRRGMPDIQRRFVWSAAKVRDLFDSMLKGFPVGYLLFWATEAPVGSRQIGTDAKEEKVARWLIVDGQQRLTSLYAVITGHPIVREDYAEARLRLAFCPLDGRFEVTDAAIERDPEFLADVTPIWDDYRGTVRSYTKRLESSRGSLSAELEDEIEERFDRLRDLRSYPFQVVELDAAVDDEEVADVFVRINSEGVLLNRADFILTLMSVFQEASRRQLEEFARASKQPQPGKPGPFNWFIQPQPDQLLRVSIALAFRRAVLRHAYSLLRGKDLETGEVSSQKRDEQFERLQEAQGQVLDLTNWHEFLQCLERAGFRGSKMISGQNALLYSYALWLIGRVDHRIPLPELRDVIARWFFMAHTTSRYSGAFETQFEADVARIADLPSDDPSGFVRTLNRMIDDTLTSDYWTITLPNSLATSAAKSPALLAYIAALNILNAEVLLSDTRVRSRLDPAVTLKKGIERHHLFPRGYLRKNLGISETRLINQIANYALVEWSDNIAISDSPPSQYWPQQIAEKRLTSERLDDHRYWHALPEGWETMPFEDFLAMRRGLMAQVVRDAFAQLTDPRYTPETPEIASAPQPSVLIPHGASSEVRFRDLIDADVLAPGITLQPSTGELDPVATVLPDGNVYMDGEAFESPSEAATSLRGEPTNGWDFWSADLPEGRIRLRVLRESYLQRDSVGV